MKGKYRAMAESGSGKRDASEGERRVGMQQLKYAARITVQGIKLGKTPAEIVSKLRQIGLTREEAEGIEDTARLACQHSQMRIGTMLMVSAVLWVIASAVVPILRPGPNAGTYSSVILIAGVLQWFYGWQRRRHARRLRAVRGDEAVG
jgi:hypothetical protein